MSCLFRSLAAHHGTMNAARMRHHICSFLQSNPKLVDDTHAYDWIRWGGAEVKSYVNAMRMPNTWGGALEIRAYCVLYRRNVHVRVMRNGRVVEFPLGKTLPITHLEWTGNHFESCRPAARPRKT